MCKQATASTYTVFNHVITRLKKNRLCANKLLRPHTLCAFKPLRPHSVCAFKPLRPHTLCANKAYLVGMCLKSFFGNFAPFIAKYNKHRDNIRRRKICLNFGEYFQMSSALHMVTDYNINSISSILASIAIASASASSS